MRPACRRTYNGVVSAASQPRRVRTLLGVFVACFFVVPLLAVGSINAQSAGSSDDSKAAEDIEVGAAPIGGQLTNDGQLTNEKPQNDSIGDSTIAALARNQSFAPSAATTAIEVHGPDLAAVRSAILEVGGDPYGEVPGFFLEARIPITQLENLSSSDAVSRLNQVTTVSNNHVDSSLTNNPALETILADNVLLDAWHSAGHTGEGQRIGILDLFGTEELQLSLANNRIPAPAGTFCQSNGIQCSISVDNGGAHGVAVAEIVHQAAPDAELYLATVLTTADLLAAVEWFASQGVTVINRSETSELDGPGDGTGPTASIVDLSLIHI